MKGKRFSEGQIIRIGHDAEALGNVRDVCRQHNMAEQSCISGGGSVVEWARVRPR